MLRNCEIDWRAAVDRRGLVVEGKKVLVVDDEVNIRQIIEFMLKQRGYVVVQAVDGPDAEAKIRSERPDLIILDVMLPGKSGFEICADLKSSPEYKDIPVLMLTAIAKGVAKSDEYWKERSRADGFISKPFNARALMETVESLLAKKTFG